MPIIQSKSYCPPFYLRNGHVNTLYTYVARKNNKTEFTRVRYATFDNDFVDVDFVNNQNKRLVLVLHGLEGSSSSQYMKGLGRFLPNFGYDVALLNHRSCSGEINATLTMYHSGFTADIHMLVETLSLSYDEVFIVGFSMGGNMALKYLGDNQYPLNERLKAVAAISVPCDLASSSHRLTHWSNYLYEREFLKTLMIKAKIKKLQFPKDKLFDNISRIKSLVTFDDYFTGPMHGFEDSADYYRQSNSLQFLNTIKKPALLISSLDDPFLTPSCFPFDIANESELLSFVPLNYGGHVGFYQPKSDQLFVDQIIVNYLDEWSSQ